MDPLALTLCLAFTQRLPVHPSPALRALASPVYQERENAEVAIGLEGTRGLRTIAAAMASRDAEVRRRGERLLNKLFRCPACHGDGVCRACEGQSKDCPVCDSHYSCKPCGGSGDTRHVLDWFWIPEGQTYGAAVMERDLLGEWLAKRAAKKVSGR